MLHLCVAVASRDRISSLGLADPRLSLEIREDSTVALEVNH